MLLDIRSLWMIGALCGIGFGLLVLIVRKTYPNQMGRVLLYWGASYICLGFAYGIFSQRVWVGDFNFNVVGHSLTALCLALEFKAVRELKRQPLAAGWFLCPPLAMFAACLWFTVLHRNISFEVLSFNLINAASMLLIARSLARKEDGHRPFVDVMATAAYLLVAGLTILVIIDVIRVGRFPVEYDFSGSRCIFNSVAGIVSEGIVFSLFLLMLSERLNRDLVVQAMHDSLTGLYNRRSFEEIAFREISGASRTGASLSLLVFDVDRFKPVNDLYGHQAGDAVLKAVAETLRYCLRDEDFLCRWGGDEFCAILPRANRDQAQAVAERVLQVFDSLCVPVDGATIKTAVSIGIVIDEDNAKDLTALVELADAALYRAKQAGRKRFVIALEDVPA